ncbi:MAG TPA: class D sortase [Candidatus Saccharimonadales bacterium]|nr:class D sortase [Candidatus Saccharimonadales bacterium]
MSNTDHKNSNDDSSPAVKLIRQKIHNSFAHEPNARAELAEVETVKHRSKHQRFMYELSASGKSLAEIQSAWHKYYDELPDNQKHEVWQEFYDEHDQRLSTATFQPHTLSPQHHHTTEFKSSPKLDLSAMANIKDEIMHRVASPHKMTKRQHLKSLLFGLGLGLLVVIILLFSFFNERFIAPFISPSRSISASSIIIDPLSTAVGPESKVIIPKINVEVPVNFDEKSLDEKVIQKDLENGVIHYAATSFPGQKGNGAIFGHSSNNIFNQGKYKFAFVLLKRLDPGDTFIIQYKGKRYVYQVYDKQIVKPTDLGVLNNTNKPATFTLITCDPPGTSLNRLVVWGQQISPDPLSNIASTPIKTSTQPKILPGNAPTLWQRIKDWL